jgi:HNH endonuclease
VATRDSRGFKQDALNQITDALHMARFPVNVGSSIPGPVLRQLESRLGLDTAAMPVTASSVARLAGLAWTEEHDSRHTVSGGGSTITQAGMWRLAEAVDLLLQDSPSDAEERRRSASANQEEAEFDPDDVRDARRRTMRQLVARQGQRSFRSALLDVYSGRCAVTGCEVEAVLEAAHIRPYAGPQTNSVQNGLLLRADIHTLFDLRLLSVHEDSRSVLLAPTLQNSIYANLAGRLIGHDDRSRHAAGALALRYHRQLCQLGQ